MFHASKRLSRITKVFMALGITVAVVLAIAVAWPDYIWPKIVVQVLARIATPHFGPIMQKVAIAKIARQYRPAAFSRVTPEEAGRALHQMAGWSTSSQTAQLIAPFDTTRERRIVELPDSNVLHIPPALWYRDLIPLAARGLTPEQHRFLMGVVDDPDLSRFRRIGSARELDVIGARYSFAMPQADLTFFRIVPIAKLSSVKRAAQRSYAAAALQLARGDATGADATLRASCNVGVLLIESGSDVIDNLVGAVVAQQSLVALAALFDATRRSSAAAQLRYAIDTVTARPLPAPLTRKHVNTFDVRDVLPAVIGRADVPPGLKWEYLIEVQTLNITAFCVGEFEFDRRYDAWRSTLRSEMVGRQSDAAFFDWIMETPTTKSRCPRGEPAVLGDPEDGLVRGRQPDVRVDSAPYTAG